MAKKSVEDAASRKRFNDNNAALEAIIRPLQRSVYEADYAWNKVFRSLEEHCKDYGGINYSPEFQRGHVWTDEQQCHFIENVLRGVISTSGFLVQFNCPNWNNFNYQGDLPLGFECIDGLQRLTAVKRFLDGKIKPLGLTPGDLEYSSFTLRNYRFKVAVHAFEDKEDLLNHYLDLNRGGTPHSPAEIQRIENMVEQYRLEKSKRISS
jgi:hypothetical protein